MILIADGGSTKVDWVLIEKNKEIKHFNTKGLNPTILNSEKLHSIVYTKGELVNYIPEIKEVFFYGAGCGTTSNNHKLKLVFEKIFIGASIIVKEDTYAAVYAMLTKKASIVSIIGTGSNSSYFNGKEVIQTVPSLGYIIMDEASGNYFGKKLLQDYFYNKMPEKIHAKFSSSFDLSPDKIKSNIYAKESPNMYLAQFSKFMYNLKQEPYIKQLLESGFQLFIDNKIKSIDNYQNLPLHFVGSIAYYYKETLIDILKKNNLNVGEIIQKPIDNLVIYHQNLIN